MIQLMIIGNLTRDPASFTTKNGKSGANFTVAADNRGETRFFNVTAWSGLAEICMKYLAKGRKVAVIGDVDARAYQPREGEARAQLEVNAEKVEFLSPHGIEASAMKKPETPAAPNDGFIRVEDTELPF